MLSVRTGSGIVVARSLRRCSRHGRTLLPVATASTSAQAIRVTADMDAPYGRYGPPGPRALPYRSELSRDVATKRMSHFFYFCILASEPMRCYVITLRGGFKHIKYWPPPVVIVPNPVMGEP